MEVMKRFDRSLFEALAPPLVPFEIVKFTGSQTGDTVHLRMGKGIRIEWISVITSHGSDKEQAYFVDEGIQLPFPLKFWRHQHIVKKDSENQSWIIDDIQYEAVNNLLSKLMYPILYAGFKGRGRIYRQYFNADQE